MKRVMALVCLTIILCGCSANLSQKLSEDRTTENLPIDINNGQQDEKKVQESIKEIETIEKTDVKVVHIKPVLNMSPDIREENRTHYEELQILYKSAEKKLSDGYDFNDLTNEEYDAYDWLIRWPTVWDVSPLCGWYCAGYFDEIKATSELGPEDGNTYKIANIHDFDISTVWAEGVEGYGVGQKIEYVTSYPQLSKSITIYNGYCKTEDTFNKNSRVKELMFSINNIPIAIFDLEDTWYEQKFTFTPPTDGIYNNLILSFEILSIYEGDLYEDTCISEIFMSGGH